MVRQKDLKYQQIIAECSVLKDAVESFSSQVLSLKMSLKFETESKNYVHFTYLKLLDSVENVSASQKLG